MCCIARKTNGSVCFIAGKTNGSVCCIAEKTTLHCPKDEPFSVLHCPKDERFSVLLCRKDDAVLPERRRCIKGRCHEDRAEGQWRTKVSGGPKGREARAAGWWRPWRAPDGQCQATPRRAASSVTANHCPRRSLGHSGSPFSFQRRGNGRVTAGNAARHG